MAHKKGKPPQAITMRDVESIAESLRQTLSRSLIRADIVMAGPFVGLTFAISDCPDGHTLADMILWVVVEMVRATDRGEQVEKLLEKELRCWQSGFVDGMKPSEN